MKVILYAQLENIHTHTPVLAPACYAMCDQIYAECKRFGKVYNISTVCAYGGGSMWEQQKACQEGAEIIVATPVGTVATPVGIVATLVGIVATPVGIVATLVGIVATLVGIVATLVGIVATPVGIVATLVGIVATLVGIVATLVGIVATLVGIVATLVGIVATPVGIVATPVGILVTLVGIVATPVGVVATLVGTAVDQWLERSPRRREVVGLILDRIITKMLKNGIRCFHAKRSAYKDRSGFSLLSNLVKKMRYIPPRMSDQE